MEPYLLKRIVRRLRSPQAVAIPAGGACGARAFPGESRGAEPHDRRLRNFNTDGAADRQRSLVRRDAVRLGPGVMHVAQLGSGLAEPAPSPMRFSS